MFYENWYTYRSGISGILVLSLEVKRLVKIVLIPIQKKNNGQFLLNCVLIIASVIKPTSPIILSASISIKVNHNTDTLYPFSFD